MVSPFEFISRGGFISKTTNTYNLGLVAPQGWFGEDPLIFKYPAYTYNVHAKSSVRVLEIAKSTFDMIFPRFIIKDLQQTALVKLDWLKERGDKIDKTYEHIYSMTHNEGNAGKSMQNEIQAAEENLQKIREVFPQANQVVLRSVHSTQEFKRRSSFVVPTATSLNELPEVFPNLLSKTPATTKEGNLSNPQSCGSLRLPTTTTQSHQFFLSAGSLGNLSSGTRVTTEGKYLQPDYPLQNLTNIATKPFTPHDNINPQPVTQEGNKPPKLNISHVRASSLVTLPSHQQELPTLRPQKPSPRKLEDNRTIFTSRPKGSRKIKLDSKNMLLRYRDFESTLTSRDHSKERDDFRPQKKNSYELSSRLLTLALNGKLDKALNEIKFPLTNSVADIHETNKILNKHLRRGDPKAFNPSKVQTLRSSQPSKAMS